MIRWIGKTNQVNCYIANHALFIEDLAYRLAKSKKVHGRQACLREETSCVDIFSSIKLIK